MNEYEFGKLLIYSAIIAGVLTFLFAGDPDVQDAVIHYLEALK